MRRKAVITGAGLVSSLGDSPAALHDALCAGRSKPGAVDLDPKKYFGARNIRPLDRTAQLVTAASSLALADSGWPDDDRRRHDVGLVVGTVFSSVRTICEFDRRMLAVGPEYVSPLDFANTVLNAAAGQAAIWHGLRGPNLTIAAGAASGLQAIAHAAGMIEAGSCDVMLAGGADELSPESAGALERFGLACSPSSRPVPFGGGRDGFAPGEGAAFVMLEAEDLAERRRAAIRAVVRGFASACGDEARVVAGALADAGVLPQEIDAISASASGSVEVDAREARALDAALCARGHTVPVVAVKACVGETLGAAGALQLIALLEVARTGVLPGIPGLGAVGVDTARLDLCAGARVVDIRTALVSSIGWDGNCCALIVSPLSAAATGRPGDAAQG
jgi:3-oxoacyl-[acyl-carrier-protein] synthase II